MIHAALRGGVNDLERKKEVCPMKWIEFRSGMRDSVPVCIGYFSVSFGFGALAVTCGLEVLQATLISLTNLTSAGQFAGLTVIAASGALTDMILTQAVINSRYALMSLALSQKLGKEITTIPRLVISFFVTDEIFIKILLPQQLLLLCYTCDTFLSGGSIPDVFCLFPV